MQLLTNNKAIGTLHTFLRLHWQRLLRIRQRIRFSEEAFHLVLAGGVGVMGGLVNLFFYYATESVKYLFLRHPGDPAEIAEMMGGVERVITPAIGGLCAGLILFWGLRLVGQQRSSNLLEVVVAGDGKLPFRTALVKFFSSLMTIGTGGSIGREGGIVQLSATLASKWGQVSKWPPYRLRLLVGCGAASGIAAAYNAPIAGAVFASMIVLGNFSMNLFAPLVFASVVAAMVSRSFFGIKPWYTVPPFEFTSVMQLPWFIVLGILAGALGAAFLTLLHRSEELFKKIKAPIYIRLALGGLLVGLIALPFPKVWGNGYVVTNQILQDPTGLLREPFMSERFLLATMVALLLAKLLATLVTVGSGAVGGVFTPTLFLGASLGATFGLTLHRFGTGLDLPVAAFALVGMGSTLAATTRSPMLAIIMVFEISLDYSLMPPLMLGCVVAILVAGRFVAESVYTEPLRRKGLTVRQETTDPGAATERTVGDIMQAPIPPVRENATLNQLADRFLSSPNNFLPVVDAKQQFIGMVALQDLKEYLNTGVELKAVIAYDVMRPPPPCVTPNQRLLDILPVVLSSEQRNIPVVTTLKENRLVGAVVRAEVLNLFSEAIAASSKPGT
ncbi:MAG TPA: ClcB-like voltage-gated chloride channel protein [Verrucomicrobiae bacterium]|nr:ClcB-like voltage-gated chloride channel protein [Verrucomicrobiae bacterium]